MIIFLIFRMIPGTAQHGNSTAQLVVPHRTAEQGTASHGTARRCAAELALRCASELGCADEPNITQLGPGMTILRETKRKK